MEKVKHKKKMDNVPQLRFPGFEGEWKYSELDKIADKKISYGIVQAGEHVENGMPYIKSRDLNTPLQLEKLQRTSDEIAKKYRRSEISPGDIVFSLRGNIGVTQIVPSSIMVANLTQGTARISVSGDNSNSFIEFSLQNRGVIKRILAVSKGSTFQEISLADLRKIRIQIPLLPEQKKIASFLSEVDQKIQMLTRKKELLAQYKKGVMQKIFSWEIRFKDKNGNDYPDWEKKQLGDIASFTKGKGISKADISENGSLECIRYGELYTHYNETIEDVYSRTNLNPNDLVLSKYDDLIIPSSGETHIDIATASCVLKDNIALGGDLNIIRSKNNGIFLAYYLNNALKISIAKLSQGNSVVHLYPSHLTMLQLNLPCLSEQEKIVEYLMAIDKKIETVQIQISQAKEFKKGLLQQMFV